MNIQKRHILLYGSALLSLVCCWVLSVLSGTLGLESQQAAERWQGDDGDMDYAQISLFMGTEANFTTDSAEGIKEMIDNAMTAASLQVPSGGARLWYGSYSTQLGSYPMSGTKTYSASALATAIGGDFFLMHPMTLLDGNYISDDDLMHDQVVLDETIAWQLFGSSDVSGMEVIINDMRCIVAGVVRPEEDYATKAAYGDTPRFYISYDLYEQWQGGFEESSTVVNCYEAVLPNPVRGFAKKTLTDAAGMRDSMRIIQNTGRESLSNRWYNLRHIHEMLLNPDSAAFPYWENAARVMDYDLAVLLGFEIFFLIWPVICGLRLLWKSIRWLNRFISEKRKAHKNRYRSAIPQI